jgi:hypothetical protein
MLACFHQELTEELGELEASSDDEAMVTTRVVRRRVIIQVPAAKLLHVRDSSVLAPLESERPGAIKSWHAPWAVHGHSKADP